MVWTILKPSVERLRFLSCHKRTRTEFISQFGGTPLTDGKISKRHTEMFTLVLRHARTGARPISYYCTSPVPCKCPSEMNSVAPAPPPPSKESKDVATFDEILTKNVELAHLVTLQGLLPIWDEPKQVWCSCTRAIPMFEFNQISFCKLNSHS